MSKEKEKPPPDEESHSSSRRSSRQRRPTIHYVYTEVSSRSRRKTAKKDVEIEIEIGERPENLKSILREVAHQNVPSTSKDAHGIKVKFHHIMGLRLVSPRKDAKPGMIAILDKDDETVYKELVLPSPLNPPSVLFDETGTPSFVEFEAKLPVEHEDVRKKGARKSLIPNLDPKVKVSSPDIILTHADHVIPDCAEENASDNMEVRESRRSGLIKSDCEPSEGDVLKRIYAPFVPNDRPCSPDEEVVLNKNRRWSRRSHLPIELKNGVDRISPKARRSQRFLPLSRDSPVSSNSDITKVSLSRNKSRPRRSSVFRLTVEVDRDEQESTSNFEQSVPLRKSRRSCVLNKVDIQMIREVSPVVEKVEKPKRRGRRSSIHNTDVKRRATTIPLENCAVKWNDDTAPIEILDRKSMEHPLIDLTHDTSIEDTSIVEILLSTSVIDVNSVVENATTIVEIVEDIVRQVDRNLTIFDVSTALSCDVDAPTLSSNNLLSQKPISSSTTFDNLPTSNESDTEITCDKAPIESSRKIRKVRKSGFCFPVR